MKSNAFLTKAHGQIKEDSSPILMPMFNADKESGVPDGYWKLNKCFAITFLLGLSPGTGTGAAFGNLSIYAQIFDILHCTGLDCACVFKLICNLYLLNFSLMFYFTAFHFTEPKMII
uniref:Uncharacterized protein n=1 Tax=Glossina pallidipes TaxID=7398 RepID=A0A1A9ZFU5_GLOPL